MNLQLLASDPSEFRRLLVIDSANGSQSRLGDVLDPWQADDFAALDPGWRRVAGHSVEDAPLRAWLERPRGHSKSSDLAVMVTWVLAFSLRQITGIAAAADKDQARILRDAIVKLVRANPWLAELLDVGRDRITNPHTGSTLTIISSDAASSYGALCDFLILDEIVHWGESRDLFDSLLSTAAKRASCFLVGITNAGWTDHWSYKAREAIRVDPRWIFRRLDGPVASWITAENLDEQRKHQPPAVFARLWLNEWSAGSGDAIDPADLESAFSLPGPAREPEYGQAYVAGLDLGLARDASALVMVGKSVGWTERRASGEPVPVSSTLAAMADLGLITPRESEVEVTYHPPTGKLQLASVDVWRPPRGGRVEIEPIEQRVVELHRRFGLLCVAYDPWQSEYLAERLRKQRVPCLPVPFAPANLTSMATEVLSGFRDRIVNLYRQDDLQRDLQRLRIVEKGYGIRLDSPRGQSGHGDAATAFCLALHAAKELGTNTPSRINRPLLVWPQTAEDCAA